MASEATVGDPAVGPGGATQELSCPFSPSGPTADGRPRPKRGYFIPGIIALVVCAAIAIVIDLAGFQTHSPTTLSGHEVDSLVSQSLQATHPQRNPPQVRCPATEPLRAGLTFNCTLVENGRTSGTIHVTETTAQGTLHFSAPSS